MSYLTTPELKSFDKCVISFWFNVPQEAMDAAQKEYDDFWNAWEPDADGNGPPEPPMLGLVPLLVFGKEGTGKNKMKSTGSSETIPNSTTINQCVEHVNITGSIAFGTGGVIQEDYWDECSSYTVQHDYYKGTVDNSVTPGDPTNPSYIAVDGGGNVRINFESTQLGSATYGDVITGWTSKHYIQASGSECWTFVTVPGCGGFSKTTIFDYGLIPGNMCDIILFALYLVGIKLATAVPDVYIDTSTESPQQFPATTEFGANPSDTGTGAINYTVPDSVSGDEWHHVLVSFDGSGGSASTGIASGAGADIGAGASRISATSTLYVAVDDKNYKTGGNLFPDTNKVVTGGAVSIAYSSQATNYVDNGDGTYTPTPEGPIPSYSLGDITVPAAPVGIPCVEKYVDKIHKCEMAELLFWTDHTLDTSDENNRRLFITAPDKNGKQRPTNPSPVYVPTTKTAVGDPPTWDWDSGPDTPAFVPPLSSMDPTHRPSGNKTLGTPDIGLAGSSIPWQSGMNLGKLKGKVAKTGKIKAYFPDPSIGGSAGG